MGRENRSRPARVLLLLYDPGCHAAEVFNVYRLYGFEEVGVQVECELGEGFETDKKPRTAIGDGVTTLTEWADQVFNSNGGTEPGK